MQHPNMSIQAYTAEEAIADSRGLIEKREGEDQMGNIRILSACLTQKEDGQAMTKHAFSQHHKRRQNPERLRFRDIQIRSLGLESPRRNQKTIGQLCRNRKLPNDFLCVCTRLWRRAGEPNETIAHWRGHRICWLMV
jgi:hypothetical protein